jgi:tetratricopeptide (TPR) repeat protein
MLSRILDVDAIFFSLQKDLRPGDQATLHERPEIVDLTAELTDFVETAALVSCLDLVITIDSSVAHLAAALGRPTWILLPYAPDYRWLLDREDSPWYPTVRLFRQTETRDYSSALDHVRDELAILIAARQPEGRTTDLVPSTPRGSSGATTPDALCSAGLGCVRAGQFADARGFGEQALAINPDHAGALHLMGLLSLQTRQFDQAVEWITRAIRQKAEPEYLVALGITLLNQGRKEDAFKAYDKAVQLKPDDPDLWKNLGDILIELTRLPEALLTFQHMLTLDPDHWYAACRTGHVLDELGRSEEALIYLDQASTLAPNKWMISEARGVALRKLKRPEESLAEMKRAHALNPHDANICNNLGLTLQLLGRDTEAMGWFDRSLALRPDFVPALINRASSLQQLHRFEEAAAIYNHVATIDPDNAVPGWNLSILRLLTGDFEKGWAGREQRWRLPSNYPKISEPIWLGKESLRGKTILIGPDEGLGDTLQFARYVPMVAERGARVLLVVQDPLHSLLSALPGVSECFPTSQTLFPPFDLHCPIMSLPLAFGTRLDTVPAPTRYLPDPAPVRVQAWRDRLDRLTPRGKLRVGLVWSGNPNHGNDHNRSTSLRTLSPLLDADASFISLQKDPRPVDRAFLRERPDIIDPTADLTDFVETAALVSCLDLVITIDSSVAHLAAALGRPTWMVLPYVPDYRWLLDREDSPWYPTMRLFRQSKNRDYGEVVERVRSELAALIAAR